MFSPIPVSEVQKRKFGFSIENKEWCSVMEKGELHYKLSEYEKMVAVQSRNNLVELV